MLPTFLIVGAPKAGTTALHTALAGHPDVFMSTPKEPKYWLCDDAPPPAYRGPGDAHSRQEWVWRREAYEELFDGAGQRPARGESTPFYLWSRGAHRRIGERLPDVRVIAVVRDPIDRAYSNWMHLWSDGLEPVADFEEAFHLEGERVTRGFAPFWRYRDLGRYGEQLAHLHQHVDPARVLVMRYRTIVDEPRAAVDRACQFLGIRQGQVSSIPRDNSHTYVEPGWRPRVLGPVVGAGGPGGRRRRPGRRARPAGALAPREHPADLAALGVPRRAAPAAVTGGEGPAGARVRGRRRAAQPADRGGLLRLALHREPRFLRSAHAAHEVVGPVRASGLDVVAHPAVGQGNGARVPERAVRVV